MRLPFNGTYPTTYTFAQHIAKGGDVAKYAGHDWSMPIGTPVYAVEAGTVTTHTDNYGSLWVKLVSTDGKRQWQYVHLSKYGTTGSVRQGTMVGYSGNSGYSTGAHLHFALIQSGVRTDPIPVLNVPEPSAGIKKGIYVKYTKNTRIRTGNGLKYPIQTTARAGDVWFIKDGVRNADGYEWWDMQACNQQTGELLSGTGWSALRTVGGQYWVVKVPKPTPPEPPAQECEDKLETCTTNLTACKDGLKNCESKLKQIEDILNGYQDTLKLTEGADVVSNVQSAVADVVEQIGTLKEQIDELKQDVVNSMSAGDLIAAGFKKLFSKSTEAEK